tara:strand:- start:495 stop:968 length:474 start_codon:yes stop_codon:yes gene_type:complete
MSGSAIAAVVRQVGGSLLTKQGLKKAGEQIIKNKINSKLAPYGVQDTWDPNAGIKLLDPGSVVREGEFAAARNAWQNSLDPGSVVREGEFATGQAVADPQQYMEQRIQAVLNGTIPPTESDLKLIDFVRQYAARLQATGGSRQNPQLLNSAQQGIVR